MNHLERLDEFQEVLENYQLSDTATKILEVAPLVALVAISATGRNTIINELVKTGDYHYVVSDTTRNPRVNNGVLEQDGVEYFFRKEEDLLEDLRAGMFLEAAVIHQQQVSGISLRELQKASVENKIAINEIEVQGVDNIIKANPKAVLPIFVLPPSYDVWMDRWARRGEISEEEKLKRMQSARMEISVALERGYYHFVVNDVLEDAVNDVDRISKGQESSVNPEDSRRIAQEILTNLDKELASQV